MVVWHREHLRTDDHLPLARALAADAVVPLFVFDPAFYGDDGLACDARIRFLHECLVDLDAAYADAGPDGGLTYAHGDPVTVLERFLDAGWEVLAMASRSAPYRPVGPAIASTSHPASRNRSRTATGSPWA